jgi:hypothetical protein
MEGKNGPVKGMGGGALRHSSNKRAMAQVDAVKIADGERGWTELPVRFGERTKDLRGH